MTDMYTLTMPDGVVITGITPGDCGMDENATVMDVVQEIPRRLVGYDSAAGAKVQRVKGASE